MRRLAAALCLLIATPASADTLIDNVTGLTLDEDGNVQTFNALLIDDAGTIAKVFKRKDKRPKKVDYRLDGKGRVLLPGLIDSHVHVMKLGLARLKAEAGFKGTPKGDPRPEDRDLAFAKAQEALLASGITTVADIGTTIEDWQSYRRAGDRGALRIRLVAYAHGTANMVLIGGPGPTPWLYDGKLQQVGLALTLDGPIETRRAWLKAPYADAPDTSGTPRLSETSLRNQMSRAAIDGFQVAVIARGDAANAAALDAIDELGETYAGDRRWRIEGTNVLDPTDAARFAALGATASMQPGRLGIESAIGATLLGETRLADVQRWRSLSDAGTPLVFGSGSRAETPQPFAAMALAMTRRPSADLPFDGWQPQERLPRETAFAAFTATAAHALFAEKQIGRIAKGLHADFLFVDRDPLLVSPDELGKTRVLETWIGGVRVYSAKGAARSAASDEGR